MTGRIIKTRNMENKRDAIMLAASKCPHPLFAQGIVAKKAAYIKVVISLALVIKFF
jgi:hypothetical protein